MNSWRPELELVIHQDHSELETSSFDQFDEPDEGFWSYWVDQVIIYIRSFLKYTPFYEC